MKLSKLKMVDHEIDLSTSDTVEKAEQCPLCCETFMNTKDLLEHVFLKHICFKCQINCEHHLSDQKRFIEEKRQDKKVSKDQCDQDDQNDLEIIDQESGNDQTNDQIPQFRIREAKSSFWCSQCDFVAISRPRLVAHETLKHKENDRGKWIVKLEELKIDQIALYLHKETSHGVDQSQQIEENEQNVLEQPPLKRAKISPQELATQELEQTKLESNQCHECLKILKSKSALEYHLDHVHGPRYESKLKYRPHKCDLCDKAYKDSSGLYNHVQSVHYKVTFNCDLCPRKLKSQGALYNHKKNIHWK